MKKLSIIPLIIIILIIILQFILPFSTTDQKEYNAFESYFEFKDIHWGFYYIFSILIFSIIGLILCILNLFEKHSFSFSYDTVLWFSVFVLVIIFMWQLQYYLRDNPSFGVKENSTSAVATLLLASVLFIIYLCLFILEQDERSLTKLERNTSIEFKNKIKGKKVIYDTTILLNPKLSAQIVHPFPIKMAVTNEEVFIDSKPLTNISFKSIREIKIEKGYRQTFKIVLLDGRRYNIMWGPTNKALPYSFDNTLEICNVLNEIFAEHSNKEKKQYMRGF